MREIFYFILPFLIVIASVVVLVRTSRINSERAAEIFAVVSFFASNALFVVVTLVTEGLVIASKTDLLALWMFLFFPVSLIMAAVVFAYVTSTEAKELR